MKKLLLLPTILLSFTVFGQTKKSLPVKDTSHIDTAYVIHGDKTLSILYSLLQAGSYGVSSSPHFSKDQADEYNRQIKYLDSIFRPQILRWHPVKKGGGK